MLLKKFPEAKTPAEPPLQSLFRELEHRDAAAAHERRTGAVSRTAPSRQSTRWRKDVAAFLVWTAEPDLESRHAAGLSQSSIFLLIATILGYLAYRRSVRDEAAPSGSPGRWSRRTRRRRAGPRRSGRRRIGLPAYVELRPPACFVLAGGFRVQRTGRECARIFVLLGVGCARSRAPVSCGHRRHCADHRRRDEPQSGDAQLRTSCSTTSARGSPTRPTCARRRTGQLAS